MGRRQRLLSGYDSAEVGTSNLDDLSEWSPYNRVTADVKISDPGAALSLFFWDADTQIGFGTPTRKVGVANSWKEVTWDIPWPPSFDKSNVDEVKFIVNGLDQHRTGTMFLDNIRLVTDTLEALPDDRLDYRFASFERRGRHHRLRQQLGPVGSAVGRCGLAPVDWRIFWRRHE